MSFGAPERAVSSRFEINSGTPMMRVCARADGCVSEGACVYHRESNLGFCRDRSRGDGVDRDLESAVNVELAATGRWRRRDRIMPSPAEGKTFGYFSRA